jgi:hypothetical protein
MPDDYTKSLDEALAVVFKRSHAPPGAPPQAPIKTTTVSCVFCVVQKQTSEICFFFVALFYSRVDRVLRRVGRPPLQRPPTLANLHQPYRRKNDDDDKIKQACCKKKQGQRSTGKNDKVFNEKPPRSQFRTIVVDLLLNRAPNICRRFRSYACCVDFKNKQNFFQKQNVE